MIRWPDDELARVLGEMGADLPADEWADRTGHTAAEVRALWGATMRARRLGLGMSCATLANRVGAHIHSVWAIERGRCYPRLAAAIHEELRAECMSCVATVAHVIH